MLIDELLNMIKATSQAISSPCPQIDRTEVDGFIISTVDSYDLGMETAIITPQEKPYPVERYDNTKDAIEGHKRWVSFIKNGGRKIIELEYGNLCEPRTINLED